MIAADATLDEIRAGLAPAIAAAAVFDGWSDAALVSGRRLQNLPRGDFETPEPGGRPISTALAFRAV